MTVQLADSAGWEIEAVCEVIDAELYDEPGYLDFGESPVQRVRKLLVKLDSDEKNGTNHFRDKFIPRVTDVFAGLPRAVKWQSFLHNDLPLITSIDAEVREMAVANRLTPETRRGMIAVAKAEKQVDHAKPK